jgi:hypothetical protein
MVQMVLECTAVMYDGWTFWDSFAAFLRTTSLLSDISELKDFKRLAAPLYITCPLSIFVVSASLNYRFM